MHPLDQIRLALHKTLMKEEPQTARRTEAIPWLPSASWKQLFHCSVGMASLTSAGLRSTHDRIIVATQPEYGWGKAERKRPMTSPLQQINKTRSIGRGSVLDQLIHLKKQN